MNLKHLLTAIAICYMAAATFQACTVNLEYDEVWTVQNIAKQDTAAILNYLELPNNHILTSLGARGMLLLVGQRLWSVRIPTLVATAIYILSTVSIGMRLFRDARLVVCFIVFSLGSSLAFNYSFLVRGYMLQLCLLSLFVLALTCASGPAGSTLKPIRFLAHLGIAILPPLAYVHMPTSAVFVVAISLVHVYLLCDLAGFHPKCVFMRSRTTFVAYGISILLCLPWAWHSFARLKEASQRFGRDFIGMGDRLFLLFETLNRASVLPVILLALFPLFSPRYRKQALLCSLAVAFSIVVIQFQNCGFPRVYLPVLIGLALGATWGTKTLAEVTASRWGPHAATWTVAASLVTCVVATGVSIAIYRPPDWTRMYDHAEITTPPDCYIVYPAPMGLCIAFNRYGAHASRHAARIPDGKPGRIVLLNQPSFSCSRIGDGSSVELELPNGINREAFGRSTVCKYLPVSGPRVDGGFYLAALRALPKERFDEALGVLRTTRGSWLRVNTWFQKPIQDREGNRPLHSAVYVSTSPGMSEQRMCEIATALPVTFYRLEMGPRHASSDPHD